MFFLNTLVKGIYRKKWKRRLHTIYPFQYLHISRSLKSKLHDGNYVERKAVLNPLRLLLLVTRTEEPGGLQSMGSLRVGHD